MNSNAHDAYLTNGNITLFCGAHANNFKYDILHSTLYANLLATKVGNNQETWWQTYTQTLDKLDYILNSRETQSLEFHNTRLFNIVVQGTESALSNNEQQALSSVLAELETFPEDSSAIEAIITRLRSNAFYETDKMADGLTNDQAFSTSTLLTIVRDDKTLLTLQASFKTSNGITPDILNQPVLTTINDGKNNIRLLRNSLDENKYSANRDSIIKKLGNKLQTDLLHLNPLPGPN